MKSYTYSGVDCNGGEHSGTLECESDQQARDLLFQKGIYPLEITEIPMPADEEKATLPPVFAGKERSLIFSFILLLLWVGGFLLTANSVVYNLVGDYSVEFVYGKEGLEQGIMLLLTKPARFSNGEECPPFVSAMIAISLIGYFLVYFGLTHYIARRIGLIRK